MVVLIGNVSLFDFEENLDFVLEDVVDFADTESEASDTIDNENAVIQDKEGVDSSAHGEIGMGSIRWGSPTGRTQ